MFFPTNSSPATITIAGTIIGTVMSYGKQNPMRRGIGNFLNSGGNDKGSMKSALSQLRGNANNPNHELVQQVKNSCGLKDDQQAKQYTQQQAVKTCCCMSTQKTILRKYIQHCRITPTITGSTWAAYFDNLHKRRPPKSKLWDLNMQKRPELPSDLT
jgi:hypothetical protein